MTLFHDAASNGQKVNTSSMRFRATLASLLTVILLSLAPFASKCEIQCDLASRGPSCHGSSVQAHGKQQMAGMAGMEQKAPPGLGDQVPTLIAAAPACHTHACALQPAVFSEQKSVVAHVSVSAEAVFFDSLQFAPEPAIAGFSSRGPPSLRPATPVSLRTTLRV